MPTSVDDLEIRPGSAARVQRQTSLLPVPLVAIAAAIATESLTRRIDAHWLDRGFDPPQWLDRGGPDDIRALLSTVAGASITVLALLLSLTMVTLSMAATQFGPRLTGAFLRSTVAKITIGVFTGLFVYSLLVLDSVATSNAETTLVPELGTTVALLLALAAVTCLVWYANAVAQSVRLPRVVQTLAEDLETAVVQVASSPVARRLDALSDAERDELRSRLTTDHRALVSARSGYVQQVELEPLLEAAHRHDAVLWCEARPGDFVMGGSRLVRVHPASAAAALAPICERHIDLGAFRTVAQDVEYAIDQMVEIGLRALSPAINDTFTALTCIDWLGSALRFLATHSGDRPALRDATGAVRVVTRPRPFPGLVDAAFDMIRQAGAANPAVTIHLIEVIAQVVDLVPHDEIDDELMVQAHMVVAGAAAHPYAPRDRSELITRYRALCDAVGAAPIEEAEDASGG